MNIYSSAFILDNQQGTFMKMIRFIILLEKIAIH